MEPIIGIFRALRKLDEDVSNMTWTAECLADPFTDYAAERKDRYRTKGTYSTTDETRAEILRKPIK